jgi:hypothetical protein
MQGGENGGVFQGDQAAGAVTARSVLADELVHRGRLARDRWKPFHEQTLNGSERCGVTNPFGHPRAFGLSVWPPFRMLTVVIPFV